MKSKEQILVMKYWEQVDKPKWINELPKAMVLNLGRAVNRYIFFKDGMGYTKKEALEEVYKFYPELLKLDTESE